MASSLKLYLTNTTASGQTQTNVNNSLGGYASTTELSATAMNSLFDNVLAAEAQDGDTEYRMIDIINDGDATATSVAIYMDPDSSSSSTVVGFGYNSTNQPHNSTWQGEALTNESTAPASPTMTFGNYTSASKLSVVNITAGNYVRICVRRVVSAAAASTTNDIGTIKLEWL
jgi:hypothetical protein